MKGKTEVKNLDLYLDIGKPEDLEKEFASLKGKVLNNVGRVTLNLYGPQILVRQFELPPLSRKEINNALKLEAAEIFSLFPDEIDTDYQLFETSVNQTKGVFIGVPKKLFNDCVSQAKKARLIPAKITASVFSRINSFLNSNAVKEKNYCIIDFFREGVINLAVIRDKKCENLREINYDGLSDAQSEIIYSLKFSIGKQEDKKIEAIYILGQTADKPNLIANLKNEFGNEIKEVNLAPLNIATSQDILFKVDLLKKYSFSKALLKKVSWVIDAVLVACLFINIVLSVKIVTQQFTINKITRSYNPSLSEYALELQEKLGFVKQ